MLEQHHLSSGLITHYEPQLPMGPLGYPMPHYSVAPQGAVGQHMSPMVSIVPPALPPTHPFPAAVAVVDPEALVKHTSMEAPTSSSSSADEHLHQQQQQQQQQIALWQQQQQQLAALHIAQLQQQHGHSHPLAIPTSSFMAGIHPPPHASLSNTNTNGSSLQPQASAEPPPTQFQAFNFPSPEEINSRQWAEQLALMGGGGAAAFWARGIHPAMISQQQQQQQQLLETLYATQQLVPATSTSTSTGPVVRPPTQEDMATYLASTGGGGAAMGTHVVPMEMLMAPGFLPETVAVNMEQLMAQQQQQQQQMVALALNNVESQQVELRRLDLIAQQVQKDPSLLQNTQCQLLLHQREQLFRHLQAQEQHILVQQEMQKQQQQQFVLGRPPMGHMEEAPAHPRSRPGVIVNQSKGN